MKYITYPLVILLIFSGCSKPQAVRFDSKEDLITYYITYVNNKDLLSLKKAFHPKMLKMITDENADFFEDIFTNELSRTIPPDRKISYHIIEDNNDFGVSKIFFSEGFDCPVKPTLYCEIIYDIEYSSMTMFRYLSDTEDGWFLIMPVPKKEMLIRYRQAKIEKEKRAEYVAKTIETMDPQIYANIVQEIKQGSLMKGIAIFKDKYGDDTTNAALVVREIMRREREKR